MTDTTSRHGRLLGALSLAVLTGWCAGSGASGQTSALGPAAFLENRGQWAAQDRFVHIGSEGAVRLQDGALVVQLHGEREGELRGSLVRLVLEGSSQEARWEGSALLPGSHHFLRGRDPATWHRDVRGFAEIVARDVYPGIDLRVRPAASGLLVDFVLQPGADPARIALRVDGGEGCTLDGSGSLVVTTPLGTVRQTPVTAHQGLDGARRPIAWSLDGRRLGLDDPGDETAGPLVISTGLEWATYLGGSKGDNPMALAVDTDGRVAVTGSTVSDDFPVTPGAFDETYADPGGFNLKGDVFVAVLAEDGATLDYATYVGGTQTDNAQAVAFHPGGVVVAGWTASPEFPVTPGAFRTSYESGEAFVLCLDATGSDLAFSTFVGGSFIDDLADLAIDKDGNLVVTGCTTSADFPTTTPGFNVGPPGSNVQDVYVTALDATASSLLWSTLYGGSAIDQPLALAVSDTGDVAIVGQSGSPDLILTLDALVTTPEGDFMAVIGDAGNTLVYSSYFGWNGLDVANCVAFDPLGRIVIGGGGSSTDFPTTPGSFQTQLKGLVDGMLMALDPLNGAVSFATYLGGFDGDGILALEVDASGVLTVAGNTFSLNFPTTSGAFQASKTPYDEEAFVTRFDARAERLLYSTYLGGSDTEINAGLGMAVDDTGTVTVVSDTESKDFPVTPGALDTTQNGSSDAVVARLAMLPQGVGKFGASTPGCKGPLAAGVTSMPQVGNAAFSLTCTAAPPHATSGFLALSPTPLAVPVQAVGAGLWLDPGSLSLMPGVKSDALGFAEVRAAIPPDPDLAGLTAAAQFFWPDACAPSGLSASNALLVTVQP